MTRMNEHLWFSNRNEVFEHVLSTYFYYCRVGNGGFVSDGVTTQSNISMNSLTTVTCLSNHLTTFAVLVDVAGVVCMFSYTIIRCSSCVILKYLTGITRIAPLDANFTTTTSYYF